MMNWVYNLCSCISPQLRHSIIDYLNSSQLNQQVIEEEKCTEQDQGPEPDPADNIYQRAKAHSYNFMKLEQRSDDQQQEEGQDKARHDRRQLTQEENDQLIDVFWYPTFKKGNIWDHYHHIYKHKSHILKNILQEYPSSSNYDKVYDSQDQTNLIIYCRLESLIKGKKINSYRFSFNVTPCKMSQYQEWVKNVDEKSIYHLLENIEQLQSDPNDHQFVIKYRQLKKLLVINPHELVTVQKTQIQNDKEDGKQIFVTLFSIIEEGNLKKKEAKHSRGWLHLGGFKVSEIKQGLHFEGYISLQLDVSVSPNMLKQPISKQIRIFAQKMSCSLKKSDQI